MMQKRSLVGLAANLLCVSLSWANADYQIGSEWGKQPIDPSTLAKEDAVFQRSAKATAQLGGATSFYLGLINNQHVMATNRHVMEDESRCRRARVNFHLLGVQGRCSQFLGSWAELDLALFVIEPGDEGARRLSGIGKAFAFRSPIVTKRELLTIGFGVANNPFGQMMANRDSDCRVFSGTDEFRMMRDPDEFSPGPDQVWSYSIGCEGSHGDSGSAIVDRTNGDVLGLIWTGKTPKARRIQNSAYLEEIYRKHSEEIWTELAYAVPASKIYEVLSQKLSEGKISAGSRATVQALLAQ